MANPNFDAFHARAQSLEDAFFLERDQELLQKLRSRLGADETRTLVIAATGVQDEIAIPELAGLPVPQFLAILGLFPMVEVAWCDRSLGHEERKAVLKLAHEMGVTTGSASHELLERWLTQKPAENAASVWEDYVRAVVATLNPETVAKLKEGVLNRARKVAAAEGGIFGFGRAISTEEQACLDRLAKAFELPAAS